MMQRNYRPPQKIETFLFCAFPKNFFARTISPMPLTNTKSFIQIGPAISEPISLKRQDLSPLCNPIPESAALIICIDLKSVHVWLRYQIKQPQAIWHLGIVWNSAWLSGGKVCHYLLVDPCHKWNAHFCLQAKRDWSRRCRQNHFEAVSVSGIHFC